MTFEREYVTIGMASIPQRRQQFEKAVMSLVDQCDKLNVYLDGYGDIPSFLNYPKIEVIQSQNFPDLGDSGKFFHVANCKGYYLTCDDDIIYPQGYVKYLIDRIEHYDRQCLISLHGRIIQRTPIKSYYSSRDTAFKFHCLEQLTKDVFVHFGGTGVMGFHTSTLRLSLADFKKKNMADIWVGLKAQQNQIPIVCAKHERAWIDLQAVDKASSIYDQNARNDSYQTGIINAQKQWNIYTYKAKVRNGILAYG